MTVAYEKQLERHRRLDRKEIAYLREQVATARREGVIEGLERALTLFPWRRSTTQWDAEDAIRAEIERLKEKP